LTLEQWLDSNYGATGKVGDELHFPCPECGHEAFSFNLQLRIGHCFRAGCGYSPNLKALNVRARTKIGTLVNTKVQEYKKSTPKLKIPEGAKPLVELIEGQLVTRFELAAGEVVKRGVSYENQYRFKLQFDGQRVYVPVYSDGELLNFVGRAAWWKKLDIPRYKYATGASTRGTIFNWDEMKSKENVLLVENTFNGIWLMDEFNGTSNFGSDLSKEQIELIFLSDVKRVVIMWDEGAEKLARRAVERLRRKQVNAVALNIRNQPDNYTMEQLKPWINFALENITSPSLFIQTYKTGGNHD